MNEAFIGNPAVTANPILYHTLLLNSASIVRKFAIQAANHGATRAEIEKAIGKYIDDMIAVYKAKTEVRDRIVIVRAAANTGECCFILLMKNLLR